jgi:hypothetical protein
MMVTEYNKRTLGFLVHEVDRIIRVEWDKVRAPEGLVSSTQSFITAITELPPDSGAGQAGRLVSILDVEQIMAATFGEPPVADVAPVAGRRRAQHLLRGRFGGGAQEDHRGAGPARHQAQACPERPGGVDAALRHGGPRPAGRAERGRRAGR